MKTKKIVAVSSALMIGTTTALTGFPAVVLAQENMQEAVTSEQEEKYTKVSVKNPVADSEELTGEGQNNGRAQHAFDGNESTVWHTLWSQDGQKKMPHWISYSLDQVTKIGRIDYLGKPAQNGVGNGVFKNIDVYYTTDPGADPASDTGWKKAGSFENITYSPSTGTGTNRAATFEFDPVEALKVKIVVRESYSSGSGQEPENQYANALEITTYAVNDVPEDKLEIGVTIDDQSYTGKSIQEIVDKNSITPKNVESLSITNGNLEYKDLVWLGGVTDHNVKFRNLKRLTVDLEHTKMYTETGEETKALPAYAFSGLNNLEEVRLSGVKELGSFCFLNAGNRSSQGLEVFEISSVTKIANHAFNGAKFTVRMKTLSLPNAQIIGNSAFDSGGANFTSVDLSGIVELGENAFKECSFEELVFPESLRSIGRNATPIKERASVTFLSETAPEMPTITGHTPFGDTDELKEKNAAVTVPGAGISSYYGEKVTNTSVFVKEDINPIFRNWNINARGHCLVKYMVDSKESFAFVPEGEKIGEARLPEVTIPEGKVFKGWSEKEDGSGELFTKDSKVEKNITLYPVFEEKKNTPPVINVEDKELTVGDTFDPLEGVTATDEEDGDISGSIEVLNNEVDTTKVGIYEVTYKVTDSQGASTTKTIYVTVNPKQEVLNEVPVIDASDRVLTEGDAFDVLEGVTATDKEDGDISGSIEVLNNEVDTTKVGIYKVTYKVTDSQGASTTKTIYVTVNPKQEVLNEVPVINASDRVLTEGDRFAVLEGVTATDKEDGNLTDKIQVLKNTVNKEEAGTYEVTYKVTDSQGASTIKTITVTVREKSADKPAEPQKPNKPADTKPGKPSQQSESPKTADMSNIGLFGSMFAGSSGLLTMLLGKRRKKK